MNRKRWQAIVGAGVLTAALMGCDNDVSSVYAKSTTVRGSPVLCQKALVQAQQVLSSVKAQLVDKSGDARLALSVPEKSIELAKQAQSVHDYEKCVNYAHQVPSCLRCAINYIKWRKSSLP